jgi:hypothetical protein
MRVEGVQVLYEFIPWRTGWITVITGVSMLGDNNSLTKSTYSKPHGHNINPV